VSRVRTTTEGFHGIRRWSGVYIVDDDGRVCEALSALLRANGRSVREFNSDSDFLQAPLRFVVACVILDMRMLGMSGLGVQKLLASDSLISVVFVTGRCDIPSTVLAMKDGAVDFLTKPIDEDAAVP
jgi:FixJ family two-component response regulator